MLCSYDVADIGSNFDMWVIMIFIILIYDVLLYVIHVCIAVRLYKFLMYNSLWSLKEIHLLMLTT